MNFVHNIPLKDIKVFPEYKEYVNYVIGQKLKMKYILC